MKDFLPPNRYWFRPEHICDGLLLAALNAAVGKCYPRIAGELPKCRVTMEGYLNKIQQLLEVEDEG